MSSDDLDTRTRILETTWQLLEEHQGQGVKMSDIARAVGIYQFTPRVFLRVIGQYNEFDNAVDFFPLLSYKLNPYTIFYVGSTYSLSDFGEPYGFKQTSRQYFLKLQYLFRS